MWEFALVFLFLSGGALSALGELIPFKWFGNGDIWGDCVKSYEVRAWLKSWGEGVVVNFGPPGQGSYRHFSDAIVHIDQKGEWGTRGLSGFSGSC